LFKSSTGKYLNADINGALGILRKVIGDSFLKEKSVLNRGYCALAFEGFKFFKNSV